MLAIQTKEYYEDKQLQVRAGQGDAQMACALSIACALCIALAPMTSP